MARRSPISLSMVAATRRSRSISGTGRLLCLWFALACYAAGYLGAAWHDARARHGVCEHGERVHASSTRVLDGDHHAPCAEGLTVGGGLEQAPAESSPARLAAAGEGQEDHDHCLVWSPSKRPGQGTTPAPAAAPPRAVTPCLEVERPPMGPSIPLILLAPGRSPPAA